LSVHTLLKHMHGRMEGLAGCSCTLKSAFIVSFVCDVVKLVPAGGATRAAKEEPLARDGSFIN